MVAEWSTAISDACLALSGFHASHKVIPSSYLASIGFGIVGAAALCGTLRFSQSEPSYTFISWHKYLAWLASVIGLPFVAAGYSRSANVKFLSNALIASGLAILLLQKTLGRKMIATCGDVLGAFSMVSILLVNIPKTNFFGILGAVFYLAGSLLFKADLSLNVIKPVDVFHYALMLGNISLLLGLIKQSPPIYYRQS